MRLLRDKLDVKVSISVINHERRNLGWRLSGTKYCQMVRDVNKDKRRIFCSQLLLCSQQFDDVIFTDESTVRCERFMPKQFRRIDEPAVHKPKPKHPLSVHAWAGMSRRGTTNIAIFTGIMDSGGHQSILNEYLKPFIASA